MRCVIFGAGKIARGFIGHLHYLAGIEFVFVEKADALADMLNERGQYTVNILGAPEKNCVVKGARALKFSQAEEITKAVAAADAVFTAVGGKNLGDIVPFLAAGIEKKAAAGGRLNIVTCENWKKPADILREGILAVLSEGAKAYFDASVGVTEAVIMRSAIEAPKELLQQDPLIVNVQDFWELPVDASRVKGEMPALPGLKLMEGFADFLERKFYTYNAANGTTSFLGAVMGYEKIADAAHDERILKILDGVYHETAQALCRKHGIPFEEQWAFTRTSLKKLQDYTIVDYIERNARDPMRKLGPDDRLVGSARLVLECGIKPENLSVAIAAAIHYENEADPFAVELAAMRKEKGVDCILENVCRLDPNGEIGMLVKEKIEWLRKEGILHE
ncbi:MAG: hypothetical protein IJC35_06110 [Oscillospiraceae bacterium]|nr:hypothetical protein [Oscillospiraceae bacterium]